LQTADVVLYDRLISEDLLKSASSARLEYAGKDRGDSSPVRQSRVSERMIACARRGESVVRLKGGDPFVFGRGGEELLALRAAGVPCTVVPGVSAATAAPALAGIPVTHRQMASGFGVFAGHEASTEDVTGIDWAAAARVHTAVFLMAVERLPLIVRRLTESGLSPETPVAVIERASYPEQKEVRGTLGTIVTLAVGMRAPAVVVVGRVVNALTGP
jgi:uroporphyrin-III C-methyltransferase